MKPAHAISLIESAYRLDGTTEEWLRGIAESAATALGSERGAMAFRYDANGGWVDSGTPALHRLSPEFVRDFFDQKDAPPEIVREVVRTFLSVRFGSLLTDLGPATSSMFELVFDRHGIEDMVGVNGLDPSGRGCMLTIATSRGAASPRAAHVWKRLAAHISAGNRLRTVVESLATGTPADFSERAEAVLSPDGKVEHASGAAQPKQAREALQNALVRIDAARSERDDTPRAVELWRGLVAGRWSLVEHFERDGRRYYLAHKNDPALGPDRALTERERQVLGYAELGHSNKLIGYSLGLSSSSVATTLSKAKKKLGISD